MNANVTNKSTIEEISNVSIIRYKEILKTKTIYLKLKRAIDILISIIGLIVLLPVFAIIAIAIKLESKGPVFFKHTRIGKNGKIIKIYKFRSMIDNAEELIEKFTTEQMKEFKENYKLIEDPRITKVGKIIRRTSLDELPQIINILKGEMSIIGPRPIVEEELKKYGDDVEKFLSVTPGLTGNWAAHGRNCTNYEKRKELELYYIDNMSFILDLKIFLKTFKVVLKKEGAV